MDFDLKYKPYGRNVYKEDLDSRLEWDEWDEKSIYKLFIKNLANQACEKNRLELLYLTEEEIKDNKKWQYKEEDIYHSYWHDNFFQYMTTTLLLHAYRLACTEIETFARSTDERALKYKNFLTKNLDAFHSLQELTLFNDYDRLIISIDRYLQRLPINDKHYSAKQAIFDYVHLIIKRLTRQLMSHLEIKSIKLDESSRILDQFNYYVNYEFYFESDKKTMKAHLYKAIRQFHKDINHCLSPSHKQNFKEFEDKFCEVLEFEPNLIDRSNFPKHVFISYRAYALFNEIASRLDSKAAISYLYRRMHEKDNLILLKEADFREWFNNQNYPLELNSNTNTFQASQNDERRVLIDLLYEANNLKKITPKR